MFEMVCQYTLHSVDNCTGQQQTSDTTFLLSALIVVHVCFTHAYQSFPSDTGGSGSCAEGFATLDSLLSSANLTLNVSGELRILPAANSTCPGTITNLTLAASPNNGTEYPHLQLWRKESDRFTLLKSIPIEIPEAELSGTSGQGVHVYNTGVDGFLMYVEVGDVIGLYQPPTQQSRFTIAFVRDPDSLSYVWRGGQANPNAPESFSVVDVSSADGVEFALPLIVPQLSGNAKVPLPFMHTE